MACLDIHGATVALHVSPPTSLPDASLDPNSGIPPTTPAGTYTPKTPNTPSGRTEPPSLLHSLGHDSPVLAVAVSELTGRIYVGTADGEIVAWSLDSFAEVQRVQAHKRAVLCLCVTSVAAGGSRDAEASTPTTASSHAAATPTSLLISSAGDPIINIWDPRTLVRLY